MSWAGWRFSDALMWCMGERTGRRPERLRAEGSKVGGITREHTGTHPGRRDTRGHTQENNLGSSPWGSLDLRIRLRGFPAIPDPIPAQIVSSDNQNDQFLMISVWPGNQIFIHFCVLGGVEVFGRPHVAEAQISPSFLPRNLHRQVRATNFRGSPSVFLRIP